MRYSWLVILGLILAPTLGLSPDSSDQSTAGATTIPASQPESQPAETPASGPTTAPSSQPTTAPASQPTTRPASAPSSQAASAPASQPTSQPAKPKDQYFALTGGRVHPVSGADLSDVTILCKNGRIHAIGRHVKVPEDAETLDASGFHVYPGLIACNTRGIVGSDPVEDTTNVYAMMLRLANAGGITTVITGNTAAKACYGTLDGISIRTDLTVSLRYGRPADRRSVRESLEGVRNYLREKEAFERKKADGDKDAKAPDDSAVGGGNSRFLQLIKREKAALVTADSRDDLVALCELAKEFGIRIVVRGAMEGWTIPDQLGRAGIKVITTPRRLNPRDEDRNAASGGSIELTAILYDRGVDVAVTPGATNVSLVGLAGRDLLNIPMEAAYAVRGGLPESAAIESITLAAARMFDIDDRVGSIEVGKDADFIVCDGRLLDFYTTVQWTVVNGRIVYDKADETLFSDIRPRTPTTQPAPYKFWPRPFKPKPAPAAGEGGRYGREN